MLISPSSLLYTRVTSFVRKLLEPYAVSHVSLRAVKQVSDEASASIHSASMRAVRATQDPSTPALTSVILRAVKLSETS